MLLATQPLCAFASVNEPRNGQIAASYMGYILCGDVEAYLFWYSMFGSSKA